MAKRTTKTADKVTDGATKIINLNEPIECPDCAGTGRRGKSGKSLCWTCCGPGVLMLVRKVEICEVKSEEICKVKE
jgi:DnaJ-class molecular chaperone